MRPSKVCVVVCLSLVLAVPAFGQTATPPSGPQALTLLQQSLAALTGGRSITDVTLSGTARRIVGPDDESGTGTLKALASGVGRMDLVLPSGSLSEIANLTVDPPAGSWSGPDRVSHAAAFHNLLTEPCWFFPAFSIARRLTTAGFVATYVGQEARNGQTVQHVSVSQTAPIPDPPGGANFEHLTQIEFFLDTATLLPAAIRFNTHSDDNALLDIPVEIRFSDYRSFNGSQIPFHIQKFLNNSLLLDFQTQIITADSGLSATNLQVK